MKVSNSTLRLFVLLLCLFCTIYANAQTYIATGGYTQAADDGGTFNWAGPTKSTVSVRFIINKNVLGEKTGYYDLANPAGTWDVSGTNYSNFKVERRSTVLKNGGNLANTSGDQQDDYPFWAVYTFSTPVPANEIFMLVWDADHLGTSGKATGHIWINKSRNGTVTTTGTAKNSDFQNMKINGPLYNAAPINASTGEITWDLILSADANKYVALAGNTTKTVKQIVVETENIGDDIGFGVSWLRPANLSTLPVVLHQFNAIQLNTTQVRTSWNVSETGNDVSHYELERSNSVADNFATIATIAATGLDRYQHVDNSSGQPGIVYYRLKMVETDGSFKYSAVVPVSLNKNLQVLKALPNPASNRLTLLLESANTGKAFIQLISPAGQGVLAQQEALIKGTNVIDLENLGRFARGTYFLKITTADGQITEARKIILN